MSVCYAVSSLGLTCKRSKHVIQTEVLYAAV